MLSENLDLFTCSFITILSNAHIHQLHTNYTIHMLPKSWEKLLQFSSTNSLHFQCEVVVVKIRLSTFPQLHYVNLIELAPCDSTFFYDLYDTPGKSCFGHLGDGMSVVVSIGFTLVCTSWFFQYANGHNLSINAVNFK